MKPHRIILIRHGECHANTDESKFATEPDYTIELTEKGVAQAGSVVILGGLTFVNFSLCIHLC